MLSPDFFASIRASLFGGKISQKQVDGLHALDFMWGAYGDEDIAKFAYVLATAFHETAQTMQPITEFGPKTYFKKYDGRKDLGNTEPGDGYRFRGRGYVQITGRLNYKMWGDILEIPLTAEPDLALVPDYAGRIAVEGMMTGVFTGKKLSDYINDKRRDFVGARRIINGQDRARLIAGYAASFYAALKEKA